MIDLQTIVTSRSKLTVIEKLPFDIKRVYYLHSIKDENRAGHAHKDLRRLLIAVHGTFSAYLDGELFVLGEPTKAMLIEPLQWLELRTFSNDAVVLVIASKEHDDLDCIRSKEELLKLKMEYSK